MSGLETKREIEQTITSGSYKSWTIGITDNTAFARALSRGLRFGELYFRWSFDYLMKG